jgi:transketolase
MALEPLADKWRSFGWRVQEVDGHDLGALLAVLRAVSAPVAETPAAISPSELFGPPTLVLAHTIKGKGVSFVESDFTWHGRALPADLAERAQEEILHGAS